MPRTVRDTNLSTRAARLRLKPRDKPYYRAMDHGLHLGYRRGKAGGRWVIRVYAGDEKYTLETIDTADDVADADGVAVLSFSQAQEKARQRRVELMRAAEGLPEQSGPYSVRNAMDDYLAWMDEHRRSARGARWAVEAFILPKLGDIECAKLSAPVIRKWHAGIASAPPRLRSKRDGKTTRFRDVDLRDPETKRRRRSSANGILMILKAALNRAWREGSIVSDDAWRRVRPFPDASAARVRYLTPAEYKRLINASAPDFRELVQAALLTGCRYAELAALVVNDFNANSGTIAVRRSKTKPRHVVITAEGVQFFQHQALGKAGDALLLPRDDGTPWTKSAQARPMKAACQAAKIAPPMSFHGLRHTWASLAVMNGAPLLVVARNLGHTDTRMVERHYGHLAPSFIADEIRRAAPRLGITTNSRVTSLARVRG